MTERPTAAQAASDDLVGRVRGGDREAFVALTRLYQQKVFVLAYSFFRNKEDALDLVQETFLRVFERIGTYREGRSFEAWLLQVAKNLCIDHYRRNRGRKAMESEARVEDLPLADRRTPDASRTSDLKDVLARCVDQLAERQRTIFLMRHVNEMRNEEIAEVLDISLGTVKSLHFKAIRNLRARMAPYLGYQS